MKKKKFIIGFIIFIFLITVFSFISYHALFNEDVISHYAAGDSGKEIIPFTIVVQKNNDAWNYQSRKNLIKNSKISGVFTAKDNNLGTIAIPFKTYEKVNSDEIVFRIRQQSKKDWYFQSRYATNQFQNDNPFPFGFAVIKNSKNVRYYFEIESLKGSL